MTERESFEESLRRSEQKLWQYLEASPDAIYVHDLKGNLLYGNKAAETMIGYSKDELIGKSFLDLGILPLESLGKAMHLREFSLAGNTTGPDEFELIRKDGSQISVEISTCVIGESDKIEVIGIVRDISERKRLERERAEADVLRRTHKTMERLLEEMNDGYCVIQGYTIVYLNSIAAEMFGYKQEAVVGKRMDDYLPPGTVRELSRVYSSGLSGGTVPPQYQTTLTRKDGTAIQVELGGRAIEYSGKPALSIVIRDISDRKLMEKALQQREHDYLTLLESTDEAIIVVDAETLKVVFGNRRSARMFGFDPILQDGLGAQLLDFIHPDDRDTVVRAFLEDTYTQERRQRYQVRANTRDGKEIWVSALATKIEFGGRVAVLLSIRDITEKKLAEDALRESEQRLNLYFENVSDVVYSLDSEFRFVSVSPSVEKLLGYKPQELIGKNVSDVNVLAPEYFDLAVSDIMRVMAGEQIPHSEYEFITKDGRRKFGQVSGAPLCSPEGKVVGLVSVARDITERQKAEEALRESERRLKDAMALGNSGYWEFDIDTQKLFWSDQTFRLFERDPSLGAPSVEEEAAYYSPEQAVKLREYGQRAIEKMESIEYDFVATLPSGKSAYMTGFIRPVSVAGGKVVKLFGVFHDITERRKMEDALRQSEQNYRILFEGTIDGMFVIDVETLTIAIANQTAAKMFSFDSADNAIGINPVDMVHPDDKERVLGYFMEDALGTGKQELREFRAVTKDGREIRVSVMATMIEYAGKPAVLFSIRDITEQKRAEEEKKRLEAQLQLAGRLAAVGELAAGVAHELNNPLTGILGFAQLLSGRKDLDEPMKKGLDTIYKEAQRSARITKNLLSFARRHEPERRLILINEVLEKTLELRAHDMKVSNIQVEVELQPDLPMTMADFHQMQQVFMNITVNAEQAMVQAHGRGRFVVKTQNVGGMIQITFADDGPGIPEENLQRIFDPFFTTKDVGKGTGLGLSICYGIVQAHSGRIYARSELGKGTTFVVEIPIVSEEESVAELALLNTGQESKKWENREGRYS
jgi:PAS domain S-box-containing protein